MEYNEIAVFFIDSRHVNGTQKIAHREKNLAKREMFFIVVMSMCVRVNAMHRHICSIECRLVRPKEKQWHFLMQRMALEFFVFIAVAVSYSSLFVMSGRSHNNSLKQSFNSDGFFKFQSYSAAFLKSNVRDFSALSPHCVTNSNYCS